MQLTKQQKKFILKLSKLTTIEGQVRMKELLEEFLKLFLEPQFKGARFKLDIKLEEQKQQDVMGKHMHRNESSTIVLYCQKLESFEIKDAVKMMFTLAHEYRHYLQVNVVLKNKAFDFSKNENIEYSKLIGEYSSKIAQIVLNRDELVDINDIDTLYKTEKKIGDVSFIEIDKIFSPESKEERDFCLYFLQANEIDAREFSKNFFRELHEAISSQMSEFLKKGEELFDEKLFHLDIIFQAIVLKNDNDDKRDLNNSSEFYKEKQRLLKQLEEEDFFIKLAKSIEKDAEKDRVKYFFANAPEYLKSMKINQDCLTEVLKIKLKEFDVRFFKKGKDSEKEKNREKKEFFDKMYKLFIQHGATFSYKIFDEVETIDGKSFPKYISDGAHERLLLELIKEGKSICSESFEKLKIVNSHNFKLMIKELLNKNQIRFVKCLIDCVSYEKSLNNGQNENLEDITKIALPMIRDKVKEMNEHSYRFTFDQVDEMLGLVSAIKNYFAEYSSISRYADFEEEKEKICKEFSRPEKLSELDEYILKLNGQNKLLNKDEVGILVDCEYALEVLGLSKAVDMRGGNEPGQDAYRFGHSRDRELYLLRGADREQYVRGIYGEVELEKRRYCFDARDEVEKEYDPFASLIEEMNGVVSHNDKPERIY